MAFYISPALASDAEVAAAVQVEAVARAAADLLEQDAATAATDIELAAGLALKQDAATAATDAELTAAVAGVQGAVDALSAVVATDAELATEVATLNDALALKQDSATAATDAELSAAIAGLVTLAPATAARNVMQSSAIDATTLVLKAFPSQTASLQEWHSSGGSVVALMTGGGTFSTTQRIRAGASTGTAGQLEVGNGDAARVGMIVKGFASQTANLAEWQSSASAVIALVSSSGGLRTSSSVMAGTTSSIANAQLASVASSAGFSPIVGRGAVSQTANLLELQDSAAVVRASFAPSGALSIGDTTQTTPMLLISGGSAGNPMVRLTRDTAQYSWALAGGGLSFTDNSPNNALILNLNGASGLNGAWLGQRDSLTAVTRVGLLSASTHQAAAGADVAGPDLRIQGGLGVGSSAPGDIEFWTGAVAASGVVHPSSVKARIDPAGDLSITSNGKGVILRSPDGLTTKKLTIDNAGALALI